MVDCLFGPISLNVNNLGRVIFVLLPPPLLIKKNAIDLDDEVTKDLDLLDNFNCLKIETIRCNGKNVEFRGEEPFLTFWEKTKSYYEYNAHFTKVPGTPLFYINGTELVVGSYLQVNNGHLIYIPAISISHWEAESEKTAGKIFDAFHELVEKLKVSSSSVAFQLPEWSSNYLLPIEKEQEGEIRKFEEELANLLETLDEKKRLLEELKQKKLLFAGIGNPLELKVKEIFELLGFETLEVAPNRDDLILKYGERIMVVEVKGITKKSAAEKHAAQLEKWVSDYHYKHEIKPKGVLIANTYSDLPLIERKETSFPAQMLPFSQAREHCLLTGLQLLCLYLDCKDDNEKKMRMIDLLFSTSGIFHEYQDWTKYIAGGA